MSGWKEAIASSSEGIATYDYSGQEFLILGKVPEDCVVDGIAYAFDGHREGSDFHGTISEAGVNQVLEELNASPKTGWESWKSRKP